MDHDTRSLMGNVGDLYGASGRLYRVYGDFHEGAEYQPEYSMFRIKWLLISGIPHHRRRRIQKGARVASSSFKPSHRLRIYS